MGISEDVLAMLSTTSASAPATSASARPAQSPKPISFTSSSSLSVAPQAFNHINYMKNCRNATRQARNYMTSSGRWIPRRMIGMLFIYYSLANDNVDLAFHPSALPFNNLRSRIHPIDPNNNHIIIPFPQQSPSATLQHHSQTQEGSSVGGCYHPAWCY